jgi:hypothetical protein
MLKLLNQVSIIQTAFWSFQQIPKKSTWSLFSDVPPTLLGRGKRKTASKASIELEAKLHPGHDPLKQDLVLTLAR